MFVTVTFSTTSDVSVTWGVTGVSVTWGVTSVSVTWGVTGVSVTSCVSVTCGVSVTFGVSVTPTSQLVTLTQCGHKFLQVSVALTF